MTLYNPIMRFLNPRNSGLIAFKGGGGGATAAEVDTAVGNAATETQQVITDGFGVQNDAQAAALGAVSTSTADDGTVSNVTTGTGGSFVTPIVDQQSIGDDGSIVTTSTGGEEVAFGGNEIETAGTVFGNQEQIIGQNDDTQSLINQRFDTFQPATVVQQSIDTANLAKANELTNLQGDVTEGFAASLRNNTTLANNQKDILGNQGTMQTGINSANSALGGIASDVGTVQTGVDTANTNIGNLGSDVAGVQSSVDTGFAAQGTRMTDLQAAVLGGQATMGDVLTGMKDDAATYYGDLSTGQTNIQNSVGGVQTGLDTLRKDQSSANTIADQARAELASTVTGGFDKVVDNQKDAEIDAARAAKTSTTNQTAMARQAAQTSDQVGGFGEIAKQIATSAVAGAAPTVQQEDFVQRLDTIKQILATQGGSLDESVRSEYSSLANGFDENGKLIAQSVDANGNQVKRGMDEKSNLVTNTYDRQGQLAAQTSTNVDQLMSAMDSLGYNQQGSQFGDLSSNGLMSQQQSGPFIQQSLN